MLTMCALDRAGPLLLEEQQSTQREKADIDGSHLASVCTFNACERK